MTPLFGIIIFHILILLRTQSSEDKNIPYGSVFLFTVFLVAFVALTMMRMEIPE